MLHQQKVCVSMGSSLGPILVNIIITGSEDVIIEPLIATGTIKFYSHCIDETLLVIKLEYVFRYVTLLINLVRTSILQLICFKIK